MTDDIFTYIAPLPIGIDEVVMPCAGGYTVYLADRLSGEDLRAAYEHAVGHIEHMDFEKDDVQTIEHEVRYGKR